MTTTPTADSPQTLETGAVWDQSYRDNLAKQAEYWMDRGAVVLPVIPVKLLDSAYLQKNPKTGQHIVESKTGEPKSRFPGKAPSYWDPKTGEPRLIQRKAILEGTNNPPSREQVLKALRDPVVIGVAGNYASPIGFCVMCTEHLVVVDLDDTDGNEELLQRASAGGHYIETTPSGGLHLVVEPADEMASWANETSSGFFTKWALTEDGSPVGEVLSIGKICLMAPTQRGDGQQYAVPAFSGAEIQTVPDITSALGIYPTANAARHTKARSELPTTVGKPPAKPAKKSAWAYPTTTPHIQTLVGRMAAEMLNGDLSVYGNPAEDRSLVLTAFAREIYGTENWLKEEGLEFKGSADELIEQMIDSLGVFDESANEPIETKAPRILQTIHRESCDIQDPDKRRKRYDYESGIREVPGVKLGATSAKEGSKPLKQIPFVIRGYTSDAIVFGVEETGLDVAIRNNQLNAQNLLPIAPYKFWADNYGYCDERDRFRIGWQRVADDLLRLRAKKTIYDPSNMRGCGVWRDRDQIVVNSGGQLLVDGLRIPFAHHDSEFTYVKSPSLKGPADDEATLEDLQHIENVVRRWNFADNAGPAFLLGWIVTAMLSGASRWRPNIWLTGPTNAGKSTATDAVVKPLIRPVGGRVYGSCTTAAGLRQDLGHSAVPVLIDEFESDTPADRSRVDQIISLVRSSSSNEGAVVAKGTTSGNAISFLVRSSFAFASIDVGLAKAQDQNRTQVIRLLPLTAEQRAAEVETMKLCATITEDLGQKVLTRSIRLLPTIEENALQLQAAINRRSKKGNDGRMAKVQAMLLAGYLVFNADGESTLTIEQADAWVDRLFAGGFEASNEADQDVVNAENSDALNCLRHLMLHRVRVTRIVGNDPLYQKREQVDRTVQELLAVCIRPTCEYDIEDINAELLRHGIKIANREEQPVLMLADKRHAGAMKIFKDTPWRNYPETLRRPGADGIAGGASTTFGGKAHQHRYTMWPITALVGDDDVVAEFAAKKAAISLLEEEEVAAEIPTKRERWDSSTPEVRELTDAAKAVWA
jgi:hypothetical protein